MPKNQNLFADIPPITDFESCQRARPLILRRFADILGVWEACANKTCTRARGCRGQDAACLRAFMQAIPDADHREIRYALDNRASGRAPGEAIARAEARVADEAAPARGVKPSTLTEPRAGNLSPASKSAVADLDTLSTDLGQARDQ